MDVPAFHRDIREMCSDPEVMRRLWPHGIPGMSKQAQPGSHDAVRLARPSHHLGPHVLPADAESVYRRLIGLQQPFVYTTKGNKDGSISLIGE
jgi:hypothetical protein